MSLALSNLVTVSSSVQDAAARAQSFGTIALFVDTDLFVGWREYTCDADGLAEMVSDGFGTMHDAYLKVSAMASQERSVPSIKVYARENVGTQTYTLTPTEIREGYIYDFSVNGIAITYTVLAASSVAIVCTALQALIDAVTGVTATDNTTDLTVEADDPTDVGCFIDLTGERGLTLKADGTDGGLATDFAAAVALDNSFYAVLVDGYSEAAIVAAAALVEANKKLMVCFSPDSDVATSSSTDIASDLETAAYVRTATIFSRDMLGQVGAALMGRQLSFDPGGSNWNWQSLTGVSASSLTQAQYGYVTGKKAGVYALFSAPGADAIGITQDVKAASGRFLDITRGVDWLEANLGAAIATELLAQEVVPNTAGGRSLIEKAMSAVFKQGERFGFLTSNWTITIPTKAEQSSGDRSARILSEVRYTAEIAGAIDKVRVTGTLTI